uniref:C2 domain-containing protein n=1 Tax=Ciona savignyi TaxID=51511 RepID=H2Z3Y0_CIOSA
SMASGPAVCVTKVELTIACRNLQDKDVTSKSDPMCVVHLKDPVTKTWNEIARTERIKNELNPDFSKKVEMLYYFEEVQQIRFSIFDIDNTSATLDDDDFLGETECSLAKIVSSKTYKSPLMTRAKKALSKSLIIVSIRSKKLSKYLIILPLLTCQVSVRQVLILFKYHLITHSASRVTEVVKNNLNPTWKPFVVPIQSLCGGDWDRKIKVMCNDWDSDGSHDLIGEFITDMKELETSQKEFPCINAKKKAKKSKYKNSGTIHVTGCKVEKQFSFLDFVFGGLQLNFTVGIDFPGSNGDPNSRDSLQFMDTVRPNEYLQALSAVGAVVQDYDTDKMYPALGFGAKIPPHYAVSHEFPLNFTPDNPYCQGIEGIIDGYKRAMPVLKFWGPTNISPIINHVARFAYQAQSNDTSPSNYYILLILTDGGHHGYGRNKTGHSWSIQPANMLDGDDGVLRAPSGQPVARDIVQFVPYREYKKPNVNPHTQASAAALAKAVLAEVPGQVTQYYRSRGMQ